MMGDALSFKLFCPQTCLGWLGGAKVLGKLTVPGRPTNLDYSRARAYCACSRCGWGLFGYFFSHLFSFLSPSLWETAQYRLKYCLKGPLSPEQPTNQPTTDMSCLNFADVNHTINIILALSGSNYR